MSGAESDQDAGRFGEGGRQRDPARGRVVRRRGRAPSVCRTPASRSMSPASTSCAACCRRFAVLAAAASGLGHNLFVLDPDGPMRHTIPFVRTQPHACCRRSASPPRCASPASRRRTCGSTAPRCTIGDRVMPLSRRRVAAPRTARSSYLWGPIDFRGPALLDDLKSRTYPTYSFFDLFYSEEQILAGQKRRTIDPAVFRDKIVFVGTTAAGLFDVFETPFSQRQDARHPDPRRGRRRHPVEPLHPRSRRPGPRRDRGRRRARRRTGRRRRCPPGGRRRRRVAVRGGSVLARDAAVRRRLLAEPVAAGARLVARAVRRRRPTSTSSKGARSGR